MSNIEHLIENALVSMTENASNAYQAFVEEMSALYNKQMLAEVSITEEELWAIAQYVIYTWEEKPKILRPNGEWIEVYHEGYEMWSYDCPFCDDGFSMKVRCVSKPNFCPNCGADMRGEKT